MAFCSVADIMQTEGSAKPTHQHMATGPQLTTFLTGMMLRQRSSTCGILSGSLEEGLGMKQAVSKTGKIAVRVGNQLQALCKLVC
jgi:hypothetical protein